MDDCCGICLDAYRIRDCKSFPCLNHITHSDCLKLWETACKEKNNTNFFCIYRCEQRDINRYGKRQKELVKKQEHVKKEFVKKQELVKEKVL